MARFAGVELGGTSVRVAIAEDSPTNIIEVQSIDTTTPDETLGKCIEWLETRQPFQSIGIASFGPVDLNEKSKTYGYITTTPKPHWGMANVVGPFKKFGVPVAFDTDVNAPAITEAKLGGHGADVESLAYITVGTGVGVGAIVNGASIHGLMHMEGGHVLVQRHPKDTYEGQCPFHGACVEGMVNNKSLAARKGISIHDLPSLDDSDEVWDFWAFYVAQACMSITMLLSPHAIVISGGLLQRASLFPKIREQFLKILNGYIGVDKIVNHVDQYIIPSAYGNKIGIISACHLAQEAAK